jgi:uncharacterized protein
MIDPDAHRAEVEAWREGRYDALRQDRSWLTLAGLGWLKAGVNRLGSDADADVVLPSGPAHAGTMTVTDGDVVADGDFALGGEPVRGVRLVSDKDGDPTLLRLGTLELCVIERGGRLAVRSWDTASEARRKFRGIDHWPVDPAWALPARFEPTPDRRLRVPDVLGIEQDEESPGDVVFEVEGRGHRLQALPGGDAGDLWIVFGDATNGIETYAGGRFLYAGPPDAGNRLTLDFNRAYNPPCVFTPFATCPLPWPANRLPVRIEAGERLPG